MKRFYQNFEGLAFGFINPDVVFCKIFKHFAPF